MKLGDFSQVWKCQTCDSYNTLALNQCGFCGSARVVELEKPRVAKEREIHDQIITLLKRIGWPYFHSRMDKPTTNQLGCPDFIIAAPNGYTLWVEVKTQNGKQTPEQQGTQLALERNGHDYYLVRSLAQFGEILRDYYTS